MDSLSIFAQKFRVTKKIATWMIAASALLGACSSETETANEAKKDKKVMKAENVSGAELNRSGLSIAYVNTDSVLSKYEMVKDIEEEIIEDKMTFEGRLKAQIDQIEKEYEYAQQQAPNLTPQQQQMLQMEFAQKEQNLMKSKQDLEQQFMERQNEKNEQLYAKIHEFLKGYSDRKGYDLILSYNGYGNVLYANDRFDITNVVVDSLNAEYTAEKAGDTAQK